MEFSSAIIETFLIEAKELLAKMEEVLLKIEQGDSSQDLINDLFRSVHTLKGSAGMFSFNDLSGFVHDVESFLAIIRTNKTPLVKAKAQVLLEIVDYLNNLLQASVQKNVTEELINKKPVLLEKLNNANNAESQAKINIIDNTAATPVTAINNVANNISGPIKVDPVKLDEIINLTGEIVIVQEYINNLIKSKNFDYINLLDNSEKLFKLIDNLKTLSLQLRMLPIKEIFSKFNRVIRDIATQQNKQIKLQITGESTELDKIIMEKINDPLLHLVRNACDHGIDMPKDRESIGKPSCGLITLQAYQENGEVVINIMDDGRGIDLEQVKQKAIKVGLTDATKELSAAEILSYIFEPGFSTSEQITDISGRGVGMDVVKKEVEKLHGSINIKTKKSEGTTVSIRLPLSLAIIDGLLIKISNFLCILPLWNVTECIAINSEEANLIKNKGYFNFRNKIIPVIKLDEFWGVETTEDKNLPNVLIIVQYAEHKIGIMVSGLQGEVQTVIKPMPEILRNLPWINGTAVLGGGEVAVILDVAGLVTNLIAKHKNLSGVMV
jgi:two-component system, chemotaxis family, sensor kinase CheA